METISSQTLFQPESCIKSPSLSVLPAPGVGFEYSVDIVDIMSDRSVKEVRGWDGTRKFKEIIKNCGNISKKI